ncbi:MAG TPA: HesA/MoeB/ThiF family protein, partial [Desulfobacteraceae bacterium]|nr:HesA/MoeB/ThiF family protein [Desulfobacteraceae bacterium]
QGERKRYDRQIMMEEIGERGQERLKEAKVFVAGAGGLGSPIAIYLAVAGIGHIRMVDHDRVELSNLNRQILHWDDDIGKKKVDSAKEKLSRLNPAVRVEVLNQTIAEDNVLNLVDGFDAIVDAMDNLPTRYILNMVAVEKGIPFFHGAVSGLEGRAMTIIPGKSACLRCLYRGPIPKEKFPVIGVTPAVIASIQATEVIKYIVGMGELLTNTLFIYDGLNMEFHRFAIKQNPECDHCGHGTRKE